MTVYARKNILPALSRLSLPRLDPDRQKISGSFDFFLTDQATQGVDDNDLAAYIAELKENGVDGFFEAIEEEKLKKLREELLREMGLTEEELAELPAEQRSFIEKRISEEIQRRMAVGSLNKNKKNPGMGCLPIKSPCCSSGFNQYDVYGVHKSSTSVYQSVPPGGVKTV